MQPKSKGPTPSWPTIRREAIRDAAVRVIHDPHAPDTLVREAMRELAAPATLEARDLAGVPPVLLTRLREVVRAIGQWKAQNSGDRRAEDEGSSPAPRET
jgi:hypothetical protein